MTKARISLGILFAVLVASAYTILQSTLSGPVRFYLIWLNAILLLTASALLTVNFFSLDKQGRIPYGSLPYRYLVYWYNGKQVPDRIKLCPMFWSISLSLFITSGLLLVIGFSMLLILHSGLCALIANPNSFLTELGKSFLLFASIYGSWEIVRGVSGSMGAKRPAAIATNVILVAFLCFMVGVGSAITGNSIPTVLLGMLKCGLALLIVGGIFFGLFTGVAYLLSLALPKIRDSFIGLYVAMLLGKLCPVIEVEKPLETKE